MFPPHSARRPVAAVPLSHSTRRPVAAISLFYFAWYGALGAFFPWGGIYFRYLGFSEAQATLLLALLPGMQLVTPPLIGLLADARRARPWLLRLASALAALAFAGFVGFGPGATFRSVALVVAVFALVRSPVFALTDAAAADAAASSAHGSLAFGRIRLWGSAGFLVVTVGTGPLLDRWGPRAALGAEIGLLVAAALAWMLPAPRPVRRPEAVGAWFVLLRSRGFLLFLGSCALAQAAGGAYDAGFSLHLARLGLSRGYIGLAWAVGVIAEVIVLAESRRLFRRFAPARLVAFALLVAAARWLALASIGGSPGGLPLGWGRATAILALQPLHGITYGLWYAASVQVAQQRGRAVPSAAQGLLASAWAVGGVTGMSLAGELLGAAGGGAMFGAASLIALGAASLAWRFSIDDARAQGRAAIVEPRRAVG